MKKNREHQKLGKVVLSMLVGTVMTLSLAGCGAAGTTTSASSSVQPSTAAVSAESREEVKDTTASSSASVEEKEAVAASTSTSSTAGSDIVRVGSLKGPTTMGLVNLMKKSDDGEAEGNYTFDMEAQPDTIAAGMVQGKLDIALVPANMAAILYNKTKGGVEVLDINTLGVLYCVTGDQNIHSVADLAGKTVYTTGQGATPEYAVRYLLEKNGVTDCDLQFKSESTEVAAVLADDPTAIAILPQPFVTVAEAQNSALSTAFSLSDEWDKVSDNGSKLITGVTVVSSDFLKTHEDEVETFLKEQEDSVQAASDDVQGTADLVAQYGIIEKAPVAAKALPECNIVCITGNEMKDALSGYLQTLYDASAESVGGTLPGDDFYYTK